MYAANALLDSNGSVAELRAYLSVVVAYTNGTTKTVSGYEIEETELVAGEHEYTVTYGGKKTTFTANIKQGPREVEIIWATDDFTYDGTDRLGEITAYYLDADGNKVMLLVSGGELKNYSADGVVFTAAFAQETEGYLQRPIISKRRRSRSQPPRTGLFTGRRRWATAQSTRAL